MKKIEIIIRPLRLEVLKAALAEEADIVGMTVSDVRGFSGPEESIGFSGRGFSGAAFAQQSLSPKVKIELVVSDEQVQKVVDLALIYARTGSPGDGKIFVLDMGDALRIRTGDRGDVAVN